MFLRIYPAFSRYLFIAAGICVLSAMIAPCAPAAGLSWKIQLVNGEQCLENQDFPGAEACFRYALKDVRKTRNATPAEIACCLQSLAGVFQKENDTEDAIPLYKKALCVLEKAHGKDSTKIVPVLFTLADIFESEGVYKTAVTFYSRAVSIEEKNKNQTSLELADCRHRLGRAEFKAGLPVKAEELYRSSLSIIMAQPELPSAAMLSDVLSDYIDLVRKIPAPEKSLSSSFQNELLKDQVGLLQKTEGVASSSWNKEVSARIAGTPAAADLPRGIAGTAGAVDSSGRIVATPAAGAFPAGDFWAKLSAGSTVSRASDFITLEQMNRQRVDFYQRMIAIDIKSLGEAHPSVARDLCGLASVYLLQKKYEAAKPLFQKALTIYDSAYGSDSLISRRTQTLLHLIAEEANPPAGETGPDGDYVKGLPPVPLAAQKLEIALQLNYLAFLNYCRGKIEDASLIYAWALADTTLACGRENTLVASCLTDYGRVLRSAGRTDEAQKMESNAHAIWRRSLARQAAQSLP